MFIQPNSLSIAVCVCESYLSGSFVRCLFHNHREEKKETKKETKEYEWKEMNFYNNHRVSQIQECKYTWCLFRRCQTIGDTLRDFGLIDIHTITHTWHINRLRVRRKVFEECTGDVEYAQMGIIQRKSHPNKILG